MTQRIFMSLAMGFAMAGCGQSPRESASLSPEGAQAWLARTSGAQLIDVRTREEYAQGHLAGSRLIPVQELEARLEEIEKERPVLVYCRSGNRSQQAFDLMKAKGFKDLHNMMGGIEAWRGAGLPVEGPLKP